MYINHLKLKNLRCFRDTQCTFRHRDIGDPKEFDNINLILGGNGSGKTTLLKAVALAVLAPIIRDAGYVSHRMVREGGEEATINGSLMLHDAEANARFLSWNTTLDIKRLEGGNSREILEAEFEEGDPSEDHQETDGKARQKPQKTEELEAKTSEEHLKTYRQEDHPGFFLAGYGATRRMETGEYNLGAIRRKRWLRYHRVASLFDDHEALTPLESWFPDIRQSKRGEEVLHLINDLLPEEINLLDEDLDGDFLFSQKGLKIPLSTLSDGYRAYIAWTTDLIAHLTMCAPENCPLQGMRGVVLVDEVDLHLHPEWQRLIITKLSKTLPNIQFIFTSHSPIVAGSFPYPPLIIREEKEGTTAVHTLEENIHGLSSEQILHSPYFGLKTTRASSRESELNELLRKAQAGDLEAARAYMDGVTTGPVKANS